MTYGLQPVKDHGNFTPAITNDATIIVVYEDTLLSRSRAITCSQAVVKVVSDGVVISNAEPDSQCIIY